MFQCIFNEFLSNQTLLAFLSLYVLLSAQKSKKAKKIQLKDSLKGFKANQKHSE